MPTYTFDPSEGPSNEEKAAEAAAMEQGEKLAKMAAEDRERAFQQQQGENEDAALIGGKFKSQEDLLKAYEELQKKLGSKDTEADEEPAEEQEEASEEAPEEEAELTETEAVFAKAAEIYAEKGELNEETIEELSKMDSKDLVKAYVEFYAKNQQQQQQAQVTSNQQAEILQSVGGEQAYAEMVEWAGQNLPPEDVAQYNEVINSGNIAAVKFAVQALKGRYAAEVGNEAPLVTGKKSASRVKPFRSNAELARAISDPRYSSDPAYRMDVEERLARSGDLL